MPRSRERDARQKKKKGRPQAPLFQRATAEASRASALVGHFNTLWRQLFTSPVHLDSALSKLTPKAKSILAQTVPPLLLRPASIAEAIGVGITEGEPWSLSDAQKAAWPAAPRIIERLWERASSGGIQVAPVAADYPAEFVGAWTREWGADAAEALVRQLAESPPLSLRAARRLGASELHRQLTVGSRLPVKAAVSEYSPFGVRLSGYVPVMGHELYASGGFEIQDEGSQVMALFALHPDLFAPLLSGVPGPCPPRKSAPGPLPRPAALQIVDACAGAGGKSLALADAVEGRGRIFSYDVSETKLAALRRRARRAGLNNIQTIVVKEGAERETVAPFAGKADLVLVDAPCSGWGVLRRNPDIKWRQSPAVLERMPPIQLRLLGEYSRLVRPGGRLVYGLCTFRQAETREVVKRFLAEHPEFRAGPGGFFGPGPSDGFFMQAFERNA
jgi:16S rRNA (cytosine967-C5)-methyltransferase